MKWNGHHQITYQIDEWFFSCMLCLCLFGTRTVSLFLLFKITRHPPKSSLIGTSTSSTIRCTSVLLASDSHCSFCSDQSLNRREQKKREKHSFRICILQFSFRVRLKFDHNWMWERSKRKQKKTRFRLCSVPLWRDSIRFELTYSWQSALWLPCLQIPFEVEPFLPQKHEYVYWLLQELNEPL